MTPKQIQQARGIARLVVHADELVTRKEIVRLAHAVLALTEQNDRLIAELRAAREQDSI